MKLKEHSEGTVKERFSDCLDGMNRLATIDQFVDALDKANFWDETFYSKVADRVKKQFIRCMIHQTNDIWASVKIQDPATGIEIRVYKLESMFDVSDYEQICSYHRQVGLHHFNMAHGYRDRAERRFGKQAAFCFDQSDDLKYPIS